MASPVRTFAAAMAVAALAAAPACASPFSAADLSQDNALLNQFNLVTLGNLTQTGGTNSNAIQGRVLVGGNATFSTYAINTADPSVCSVNCSGNTTGAVDNSGATYGALTVFGNLVTPSATATGTYAYVGVGAGDVDVKGTGAASGSITGSVLLNTSSASGTGALNVVNAVAANNAANVGNAAAVRTTQSSFAGGSYTASNGVVTGYGPTPQVNQTLAAVFPFGTAYQTAAQNLTQGIANLPGSPGVSAQALPTNTTGFFTVNSDLTAGGLKYGVVTTTLSNLSTALSNGLTGFSTGTNSATFVIVTGDGANYTLPSLGSYANANNVIFDFVNATTLKFAGNWNGSILAPLANITQQGGTINGSVVVASIAQSNALNDGSNFAGNLSGLVGLSNSVPEPVSFALLAVGALGAGLLRRRRG